MKLDETLPHLRAAAGIYADALADGMRLYFGGMRFAVSERFLFLSFRHD